MSDVPRVAALCRFVIRIIRPNMHWEQETILFNCFLRSLSNILMPQMFNGQDPTYNPLAPKTFETAIQVVADGSRATRKGRSSSSEVEIPGKRRS